MNSKKDEKNYLDYVPIRNDKYKWFINDKNHVVVDVVNRGFYNKMAQRLFNKPKISHIELDDYGTFIWNNIDGNNSIYNISEFLKDKYGQKAEPLYNRLIKYFEILKEQKFITFKEVTRSDRT